MTGPHARLRRREAEDTEASLHERGSPRGTELPPCCARLSTPELCSIRGLWDVLPLRLSSAFEATYFYSPAQKILVKGGPLSIAGGGVGWGTQAPDLAKPPNPNGNAAPRNLLKFSQHQAGV